MIFVKMNIKNTNVINKTFFNNRFKYMVSLFIALVGIFSLIGGTSYAILKGNTSSSKEQVIKTGSIKLKLTEKFENMNKKIIMMSDSDGLLQADVYEFNLKNIGDNPAKYDLKLVNEVPSDYTGNVLDTKYIKVGLEINGEEYGPFSLEEVKNVIDSDIIYENEMVSYTLRVWLDENKSEELINMENYKSFLKIKVEAEQRVESMDGGVNTKVFNYTGDSQMYYAQREGYYYIEMAGASGGASTAVKGLGAKTSGYIYLKSGDKLYFYVGSQGKQADASEAYTAGGYNGGGSANFEAGTGGGATDVRLVNGASNDISSLISRIMVAGGGGGGGIFNVYEYGGNGGILYGKDGGNLSDKFLGAGYGGTQTSGGKIKNDGIVTTTTAGTAGSFLTGGNGGYEFQYSHGAGAGGGGYYGGAGGSARNGGGGGGSSYISGYAGVNSVGKSTTISHTDQTLHYSGKYFIGGQMISGVNEGNGYAKISYVDVKPKRKNTKLNNVRYIKNCVNYNTANNGNHWLEVQAIKEGINIAKGKSVTATTEESSTYPYSRITDGNIIYENWAAPSSHTNNQCITVDLESTYDLDEVAVWNYFGDQRSYYDNVTYVSSNNSTWTEVINDATIETSNGHRINAYTDVNNGYISDGLVLWYDGYANTGKTRTATTTTWKNLASSSYTGNLTGGTWYDNYLYLDGADDWVKIAEMNYANPTIEVVYSKKSSTGSNEVLVGNFNAGGYGIAKGSESIIHGQFYLNGSYQLLSYPLTLNKVETLSSSYSGSYQYLYANSSLVSSADRSGTSLGSPSNSTVMAVGANPNGSTIDSTAEYYIGNIYSVRIYNKALTSDEILHNYIQDKQKFNLE